MRPSQRDQILNAAIRVVERTGVTGVTFDAVAAEAGITRGGLMYHFRSREALLEAINLHLAHQWEAGLERHAGKRADEATPDERMSAFIRNSTTMASRAELLFLLEFARDPALVVPWDEIGRRWAAPPPDDPDDEAALARFMVRLAADGLWAYEYLAGQPLPDDLRQRVAERLTGALAPATAAGTAPSPATAAMPAGRRTGEPPDSGRR